MEVRPPEKWPEVVFKSQIPPEGPDQTSGAAEPATELGYKLEHFWLTEPGMTPARFA